MTSALGVDSGALIEELLCRRSIQGIPRTVKYSMSESEMQKDLHSVLHKLSSHSDKMQQILPQEKVRLTPRRYVRIILLLSAYILLVPVCIYHVIDLGYGGYTQEMVLYNISQAKNHQITMTVMLKELAETMSIYFKTGGNYTQNLVTLHKHSDKILGNTYPVVVDCSKDNNLPLDMLQCTRKITLKSVENISEVVHEYGLISKHLYNTTMKHIMNIENIKSFVPIVTTDKLSLLATHLITGFYLSLPGCNITIKDAILARSEAHKALGCLNSIYVRSLLPSVREDILSIINLIISLTNKTEGISKVNELYRYYRNTSLTWIIDKIMSVAEKNLKLSEKCVKNAIHDIKSSKIMYAVLIVITSLILVTALMKVFQKEKDLTVQTKTLETLKEEVEKQSEETESCLSFYVPREFFDLIPSDENVTIITDVSSKYQTMNVQSEKNRRRGINKSHSAFLKLSDWTKKLIQNKKKTGKYSCPVRSVAVPRHELTTTLQMKTVTVLKSDIVKFNRLLQYCTPDQLTNIVTGLMRILDDRIKFYDVYVLNRRTDSYTVVSGINDKQKNNHAIEIANMALDIMNTFGDLEIERLPDCKLRLRIGIHTGICFETISGPTVPRFSINGEVLSMANKLEKTSIPNRIHISQSTYDRLNRHRMYNLQRKGKTDLKNERSVQTYWLLGRRVSVCQTIDERRRKISHTWKPLELEMKAVYDYDSEEKGYIPIRRWMLHRYSLESWSDGGNSSLSSLSFRSPSSTSPSTGPLAESMSRRNQHDVLDERHEDQGERQED